MLRCIAALMLIAALAASSAVEGRIVHPIFNSIDTQRLASSGGHLLDGRKLMGCDACTVTCQQVHYKKLCKTLTTLPGVTTPEQLLEASLRVATYKAKMAEGKLASAMKSSKNGGNAMVSSLKSCMDSYESLVDSLRATQAMLKSGDSHSNVMSELSAADTFATDCDDIFEERPELQSPATGTRRRVSRLVSNCLDLAATIKH